MPSRCSDAVSLQPHQTFESQRPAHMVLMAPRRPLGWGEVGVGGEVTRTLGLLLCLRKGPGILSLFTG